MKNSIQIEKMTLNHIDDICIVENASFSIPWSRKAFIDEINNDIAVYFVAVVNGSAIGYIGMWEISGQSDITNIAVLPKFRRNHIASDLLSATIEHCKKNNLSPITLEVRKSNSSAIALYTKFGFNNIGFRKNYYADNKEDAIIMSLEI